MKTEQMEKYNCVYFLHYNMLNTKIGLHMNSDGIDEY